MVKKVIILILLGLTIVGFSNIFLIKNHGYIPCFISLSALSFLSAFLISQLNIKFLVIKILLFISVPLIIFFTEEIIYNFEKSLLIFHLLYLGVIVTFFILGHLFRRKKIYILIFSFLIIGLELFFINEILYFSNNISFKETEQIPDFELTDLNGNIITKKDFKGKVVFFDFWTTTCGYCIAQFPSIYKVAENFKDNPNVLFYLIDYNGKYDDAEYVKKIVKQRNIRLPVLIDKSSELSKKMNCSAFPHSFISDKNLNIRYHHAGYNKTTEKNYIVDVTNRIKELLNE